MKRLIVELIPDSDLGGFKARLADIPAHGEGEGETLIPGWFSVVCARRRCRTIDKRRVANHPK